jgi:peptidoglycan/LPS O-acetylase OafA/YrhL
MAALRLHGFTDMLTSRLTPFGGGRDLRIDWLRGLAMTCVIIDHSRRSSILSWFSYQRFWVVTAAEVFVVLSGLVLGMVYGRRLARDGWASVATRIVRRALMLYAAFMAVTLSLLALSCLGIDVSGVATWDPNAISWFMDPRSMSAGDWRDLFLLHYGPWPFEIVGLYIWLVLAALPCLLALHFLGWRPLLALSWAAYLWYCIAPQQLTASEFESVFPILAWQLLFVHGITIGYHHKSLAALRDRCPKPVPVAIACASVAFMAFALCNPEVNGPSWLRWRLISGEQFSMLYERYFSLSDLGIGRILNLAVALPFGYAVLASRGIRSIAFRLQPLFVTLGQASLAAFVLHVYGLLLVAHLPESDHLWINTIIQIALILGIAGALKAIQLMPLRRRLTPVPQPLPV